MVMDSILNNNMNTLRSNEGSRGWMKILKWQTPTIYSGCRVLNQNEIRTTKTLQLVKILFCLFEQTYRFLNEGGQTTFSAKQGTGSNGSNTGPAVLANIGLVGQNL